MSSKRFAGEVIWSSCALGFNETCFGFCVFAVSAGHRRECGRMRCKVTPAVDAIHSASQTVAGIFFLLHAAKMQSSCEEGPGQNALQSAYHNPKLDVTELKQNRTSKFVQAKNCKQTN